MKYTPNEAGAIRATMRTPGFELILKATDERGTSLVDALVTGGTSDMREIGFTQGTIAEVMGFRGSMEELGRLCDETLEKAEEERSERAEAQEREGA